MSQMVFAETGGSVDMVLIDGRGVVEGDGRRLCIERREGQGRLSWWNPGTGAEL